MKLKKSLFTFALMFAIVFTLLGIVSVNMSFAKPIDTNDYSYNVFVDNVTSENIDVYNHENSYLSYMLLLDSSIDDYYVTFNIVNDSSFNLALENTLIDELPDELKDLLTCTVDIKDKLSVNEVGQGIIRYKLKSNLTNKEKNIVDNYYKLGINVVINYNQE